MESFMDARTIFNDLTEYLKDGIPIVLKSLEGTLLPGPAAYHNYSDTGIYYIVNDNELGEKVSAVVTRNDLFCDNEPIKNKDQVYVLEIKLLKGTQYEDFVIDNVTSNAFLIIALINKICNCYRNSERVRTVMLSDLVTKLEMQDPGDSIYFTYDYISFDGRNYRIEVQERNRHIEAYVDYRLISEEYASVETVRILKGREYNA